MATSPAPRRGSVRFATPDGGDPASARSPLTLAGSPKQTRSRSASVSARSRAESTAAVEEELLEVWELPEDFDINLARLVIGEAQKFNLGTAW